MLLILTFIITQWCFDLFNLILHSERIDVAYLKLSFVLFIGGFVCHYHLLREYIKHISMLRNGNKPQVTADKINNLLPILVMLYLGAIVLFIQGFRYIRSFTLSRTLIIILLIASQLTFSFLNASNALYSNSVCVSVYSILMLIGIVVKLKGFIIM